MFFLEYRMKFYRRNTKHFRLQHFASSLSPVLYYYTAWYYYYWNKNWVQFFLRSSRSWELIVPVLQTFAIFTRKHYRRCFPVSLVKCLGELFYRVLPDKGFCVFQKVCFKDIFEGLDHVFDRLQSQVLGKLERTKFLFTLLRLKTKGLIWEAFWKRANVKMVCK